MPIRRSTTRTFHRNLYAKILQSCVLLKRNDDQQEGTVTSYQLFNCRRSRISRSGEPLVGDESSNHSCSWHVPRVELSRVGVDHIMVLDRIVDVYGRYWQPESTTYIIDTLIENHVCINCLRTDPYPNFVQIVQYGPG